MMHKSGRNDTKNPGSSTKEPVGQGSLPSKERGERYLNDYITRKQEAYGIPVSQRNTESVKTTIPERSLSPLNRAKKKSFDSWYKSHFGYNPGTYPGDLYHADSFRECWKAAQENL